MNFVLSDTVTVVNVVIHSCSSCFCVLFLLHLLTRCSRVLVGRDSSSPAMMLNGMKVVKLSIPRLDVVSRSKIEFRFQAFLTCSINIRESSSKTID